MTDDLFALFDPGEEIEISRSRLPHWYQPGKTYFITFRTADSMPKSVASEWHESRDVWLKARKIDPSNPRWRDQLARLPIEARREFYRIFVGQFHRLLDDCHGECGLRRPELAKIAANSLLHFDGERYEMGDFVVMPNHIHLLVQFTKVSLKAQCESWKHFTATQINRATGPSGSFWQTESFDHLARSEEQFEAIRQYIADNPRKANLTAGEYIHYVRPAKGGNEPTNSQS